MNSNHRDALIVLDQIVEKLKADELPNRLKLRKIPNRRCKQSMIMYWFAHRMPLELPEYIEPLETNPISCGYQDLFDADDPETRVQFSPFCSVTLKISGRTVLDAFWDDHGRCFAWIKPGDWIPDLFRWAKRQEDPQRLSRSNEPLCEIRPPDSLKAKSCEGESGPVATTRS